MSAAVQQVGFLSSARRWSEVEATRAIGKLSAAGVDLETTLDRIAGAVLGIRGVRKIILEPGPELAAHLGWSPVWGRDAAGETLHASASSEIKAAQWSWGQYRVYFDLRECKLESPLAFTRFVAQQIACFLNRLALLNERDIWLQRKARQQDRLTRRKLVERAKGILAEKHALSQDEALRFLVSMARQSRRSLRRVAQAVIFPRA